MHIDLRSDTITRPTPLMLEAMFRARVGDDVFGEDPTVCELEEKAADMLGMEAGLFCASGTMCNQVAIRVHTQPQDELICDHKSHIYLYEVGGIASNSGVSVMLLQGERGIIKAAEVAEALKPADLHYPRTRLVCLENTVNKGGGSIYRLDEIKAIHTVCQSSGLAMHLDGARLFNALVETGENAREYGMYFDTISICLSKGLGAPVGSVLLGSRALISEARRVRKVFGGGWRQAGYLAAAGIYALDNHIERLCEDHRRARVIARHLVEQDWVSEIMPVETNIVIFRLKGSLMATEMVSLMRKHGILSVPFGKQEVRLVTHLDFDDGMLNDFSIRLRDIRPL